MGEYIVNGAMCLCTFGTSPGKLKVTDNNSVAMNGKFAATTLTLGNVFEPPGCGVCNMNPMTPKPCSPSIVQWMMPYMGVTINGSANPLLDSSMGTCANGGVITFQTTGQIPIPGVPQVKGASPTFFNDLNPMNGSTSPDEIVADNKANDSSTKEIVVSSLAESISSETPAEEINVQILDETGAPVSDDFIQIVNIPQNLFGKIPKEKQTIEGKTFQKYQLGNKINYKVTLKNIKEGDSYNLYLVPAGGNVQYSKSERERNNNFNYQDVTVQYVDDSEQTIKNILVKSGLNETTKGDFFLTQAGGNQYTLVLRKSSDNSEVTSSKTITTWRKLFYIEADINNAVGNPENLKELARYLKDYFIDMTSLVATKIKVKIDLKKLIIDTIEKDLADITEIHENVSNIISKKALEGFEESLNPIIISHTEETPMLDYENKMIAPALETQNEIHYENEIFYLICLRSKGVQKDIIKVSEDKKLNKIWVEYATDRKSFKIKTALDDTCKYTFYSIYRVPVTRLSFSNNQVIITTKNRGTFYKQNTLYHEIGHNIGLSPSGDFEDLDRTENYDTNDYWHCKFETCVMYPYESQMTNFCLYCRGVMRKLDLLRE